MAIIKKSHATCDICYRVEVFNGNDISHGWITITLETNHESRPSYDKHFCFECVANICDASRKLYG